jgi:predicted acylesterase/phospholipase RssA
VAAHTSSDAHGILQLGLLAAYLEKQSYDSLYCTSVGALNGFMLHQNQFSDLINIWKNVRNNQIYHWNPLKAFGSAAALASSQPLANLIKNHLDCNKLNRTDKKCFVSATNVTTMKAETRQVPHENTAQWILASASAPIAFPVQQIDGQQYIDGGPTRDFNIEQAIADGHTEIVALCPSAITPKPIRNLIDILEFQMAVQASIQFNDETRIAQILNKSQHVVSLTVYRPDRVDFGLLDFNYAGKNFDKLFQTGYNMLSKPTIQYRRVLEAGQPKWKIYK